MAAPKAGATYTLTGDTLGAGGFAEVSTGTKVTVREVVRADVIGAGDDSEDSVVVEFDAPYLGKDDDGNPVIAYTPRAFSVPTSQFGDLFTKES